ncbi:MAG: FAD-dependent oxidoreductase [Candidatus Thiodiazotropha sp.]|jgi:NAD(P)H-nitrite reductase large subunit
MHHLVIGAGPAGVNACETLRRLDPACQITLISGESAIPYSRMAIPYLLVEQIDEQGTYLRKSESHYSDLGITLLHDRVTRIDPQRRTLQLAGGTVLPYDRCLIATGATPLKPPIPGIDLPGVHSCWTLEDARAIIARARPGAPVVLIGAGFIGCIIMESLVDRGVNLSVVEKGDRMVPRMLDEVAGGLLRRWCETKGVKVMTECGVDAIESDASGLKVLLDSGANLPAELVITAMGVSSNIGFLQGSGIQLDQGVLVDDHLQTKFPEIFAAGDVAQGRDFSSGGYSVQAIQTTAVEHARIAAHNMVGNGLIPHRGSINMNILDTLGLISASFGQWMGVPGGEQAIVVNRDSYDYLTLHFEEDRLIGASSLGHSQHLGVLRGLIGSRASLGIWKDRLIQDPTRLMEAYLGSVQGVC